MNINKYLLSDFIVGLVVGTIVAIVLTLIFWG